MVYNLSQALNKLGYKLGGTKFNESNVNTYIAFTVTHKLRYRDPDSNDEIPRAHWPRRLYLSDLANRDLKKLDIIASMIQESAVEVAAKGKTKWSDVLRSTSAPTAVSSSKVNDTHGALEYVKQAATVLTKDGELFSHPLSDESEQQLRKAIQDLNSKAMHLNATLDMFTKKKAEFSHELHEIDEKLGQNAKQINQLHEDQKAVSRVAANQMVEATSQSFWFGLCSVAGVPSDPSRLATFRNEVVRRASSLGILQGLTKNQVTLALFYIDQLAESTAPSDVSVGDWLTTLANGSDITTHLVNTELLLDAIDLANEALAKEDLRVRGIQEELEAQIKVLTSSTATLLLAQESIQNEEASLKQDEEIAHKELTALMSQIDSLEMFRWSEVRPGLTRHHVDTYLEMATASLFSNFGLSISLTELETRQINYQLLKYLVTVSIFEVECPDGLTPCSCLVKSSKVLGCTCSNKDSNLHKYVLARFGIGYLSLIEVIKNYHQWIWGLFHIDGHFSRVGHFQKLFNTNFRQFENLLASIVVAPILAKTDYWLPPNRIRDDKKAQAFCEVPFPALEMLRAAGIPEGAKLTKLQLIDMIESGLDSEHTVFHYCQTHWLKTAKMHYAKVRHSGDEILRSVAPGEEYND